MQPRDHADGYDPYRTPPLWEEPKEPLDYDHHAGDNGNDCEDHETENDGFDDRPESPIRELAKPRPNSSHGKSSMKFLDFLIPPISANPEQLRRYRLAVSLAIIAVYVTVPIMFGWVPGIPSAFARASQMEEIKVDMQGVKDEMKGVRIGQIDEKISKFSERHCLTPSKEAKGFYNEKLRDLAREYRDLTKTNYDIPTCRQLGVTDVEVSAP